MGPIAGELIGNESKLDAKHKVKAGNLIKIMILIEFIQFSISENVKLKDWWGLIQTLSLKDTGKDNSESREKQQVVNNEKTVENVI